MCMPPRLLLLFAWIAVAVPGVHRPRKRVFWEHVLTAASRWRARVDTVSFNRAISACGHWCNAIRLLGDIDRQCIKFDVISIGASVGVCGRARQWAHAAHFSQHAANSGINPNVIVCASAAGAAVHWLSALDILGPLCARWNLELDVAASNTLVTALSKSQQWQDALQVAHAVRVCGLRSSFVTCGASLSACEKGNHWSLTCLLLRDRRFMGGAGQRGAISESEAVSEGQSRIVSRSTAISACGKTSRWHVAVALLLEAPREQVFPDLIALNAAISACGAATRCWSIAIQLAAGCQRFRLKLDSISQSAMLGGFEKGRRWTFAVGLLDQCRICGSVVPAVDVAMRSCGSRWVCVLGLLRALRRWSTELTSVALNAALGACQAASCWEAATGLLTTEPVFDVGQAVESQVVSCNVVMTSCENAHQWEAASALLNGFRHGVGGNHLPGVGCLQAVAADIVSHNTVLSACGNGQQWMLAGGMLENLRVHGLQPTVVSCSAAIAASQKGSQWSRALTLFRKEGSRNPSFVGNDVVHGALVCACGEGREWALACSVVGEIERKGLQVNAISCNAALEACGAATLWLVCLAMVESSRGEGLTVACQDLATRALVASACGASVVSSRSSAASLPALERLESVSTEAVESMGSMRAS